MTKRQKLLRNYAIEPYQNVAKREYKAIKSLIAIKYGSRTGKLKKKHIIRKKHKEKSIMDKIEDLAIYKALIAAKNNIKNAAKILGVTKKCIEFRLKKNESLIDEVKFVCGLFDNNPPSDTMKLETAKITALDHALRKFNGNIAKASRYLGVSRPWIYDAISSNKSLMSLFPQKNKRPSRTSKYTKEVSSKSATIKQIVEEKIEQRRKTETYRMATEEERREIEKNVRDLYNGE